MPTAAPFSTSKARSDTVTKKVTATDAAGPKKRRRIFDKHRTGYMTAEEEQEWADHNPGYIRLITLDTETGDRHQWVVREGTTLGEFRFKFSKLYQVHPSCCFLVFGDTRLRDDTIARTALKSGDEVEVRYDEGGRQLAPELYKETRVIRVRHPEKDEWNDLRINGATRLGEIERAVAKVQQLDRPIDLWTCHGNHDALVRTFPGITGDNEIAAESLALSHQSEFHAVYRPAVPSRVLNVSSPSGQKL